MEDRDTRAGRTSPVVAAGSTGAVGRVCLAAAVGVALAAGGVAIPAQAQTTGGGAMAPANKPARDGNIAIQEEFEAARLKDTVEAWELFIARHPEHPLTAQANERLAYLRGQAGTPGVPRDGDVAIQEEFEAARMKDTVEAWELFVARHPGHPLTGQANERLSVLRGQDGTPGVPRDGNIAIQEEFEAARMKDTVEGWELFIARHPGHALTAQAQERLAYLRSQSGTPGVPRDGDIAIQEEFDAARMKDTVEAWEMFIARHPSHPLTVQAQMRVEHLQTAANTRVVKEPYQPRDGNVAILEEYEQAARKNTIAGWELFIARHPDHVLAQQAKTLLRALKSQ